MTASFDPLHSDIFFFFLEKVNVIISLYEILNILFDYLEINKDSFPLSFEYSNCTKNEIKE